MFPRTRATHRTTVRSFIGAVLTVGLVVSAAGASADGKAKGKDKDHDKKPENSRSNDDSAKGKGNDDDDDGGKDNKPTCRGDWAAASSHRPTGLRPRAAAGIYLWHDGDKWNLYATHADKKPAVFQGSVRFDVATDIDGKSLERRSDVIVRTPASVDFTFRNQGDLDGLRFKASCATNITVAATLNGGPVAVFVGRNATPTVGTFTEQRVLTPVPTTIATTTTPPCAVPPWNPTYSGAPGNLRRGAAAGLYLWIDGDRLRLQTTRPNRTASVIAGVVSVNAPVLSVKRTDSDSGNDVVTPAANGATFSFTNSGGIDGLELRSPCATQILISATIDGREVVTQQVWIGKGAINPVSMPVTLLR